MRLEGQYNGPTPRVTALCHEMIPEACSALVSCPLLAKANPGVPKHMRVRLAPITTRTVQRRERSEVPIDADISPSSNWASAWPCSIHVSRVDSCPKALSATVVHLPYGLEIAVAALSCLSAWAIVSLALLAQERAGARSGRHIICRT